MSLSIHTSRQRVSVTLRAGAIGLAAVSLGACVPDCDGRAVTEQMKYELAARYGAVKSTADPSCFGGCSPFIDGDKVQFITLENQGSSQPLKAVRTFSVPKSAFFDAIQITLSNVRILAKDSETKAAACLVEVSTQLDFSKFEKSLLSQEVTIFKNFNGSVPLWQGQKEAKGTVEAMLRGAYRGITWNAPLQYVVQKSKDGVLNVTIQ